MLSADLNAISDLLDRALDLDARAREPWLADLARTEPGLAIKLKTLLSRQGELETDQLLMDGGRSLGADVLARAIEERTGSLETTPATQQFVLQRGISIGPYRLLRPLGEGGMASVWLAERSDGQLKREVALKLLHAWRNSAELVERFARERDMLAGLVHPNIARLYDAGVTPSGQPWIALEYVEGIDFAAFADQNSLTIRSRVESMLQVMGAVQYAHQNLIVHRDLKPTNILVNKKGEVRLLDFGIAKLLQADTVSAAETELTRSSGRLLTLRYAAPEQIEGKPVTTATDVYALGLVLYELLTGSSAREVRNQNKKRSKQAQAQTDKEAERAALSTDILRPSRGVFDAKIADVRGHATPAEIKSALSGDLDTIVLKALAREPARRYQTVSAFAADLNAWLERRPITARAPSRAYALRMFMSRQRVPVGIAAFTLLTLVAAGGYSFKQRADMELHRARAEEVQTFMANLLTAAEPEGIEDEQALTAKSLLDAGVERARFDYAAKPLMQGEMIAELAPVYMRIGERETGEKLLKEAIALIEPNAPGDEPSLHMARAQLGGRLLSIGEHDHAIAMLNSVLTSCNRDTSVCRNAKGSAHYYLADDRTITTDQKLEHSRAAFELFDAGSANSLQALITSADFERLNGDFQSAQIMLSKAEAQVAQRPTKSSERASLGLLQVKLAFDLGEYAKANQLAERVLVALNSSTRGVNSMQLYVYRAHIANYQGLSQLALEQASLVRNVISTQKPNSILAYALRYEARAFSMAGKHAQAAQTVDEAFTVLRKLNSNEKSGIWLDIARADAEVRARRGDMAQARSELTDMLVTLRANDPSNFRDFISTLDLLGAISLAMGDATFALTCHNEEIHLLEAHFPADHPLRTRAELQALRANMQIAPDVNQKILLTKLVQQLKKHLPEGSIHAEALSQLVGNESSESNIAINSKQLVLIF